MSQHNCNYEPKRYNKQQGASRRRTPIFESFDGETAYCGLPLMEVEELTTMQAIHARRPQADNTPTFEGAPLPAPERCMVGDFGMEIDYDLGAE